MTAPEFFKQAKCANHDTPELFFSDSYAWLWRETAAAKKICADCPIRFPCLEYALERPSMWGIWGATTAGERKELRKRKVRAA